MKKLKLLTKKKTTALFAVVSIGFSAALSACGTTTEYPVGIVVSNKGSILLDGSFSESVYKGVARFMNTVYQSPASVTPKPAIFSTKTLSYDAPTVNEQGNRLKQNVDVSTKEYYDNAVEVLKAYSGAIMKSEETTKTDLQLIDFNLIYGVNKNFKYPTENLNDYGFLKSISDLWKEPDGKTAIPAYRTLKNNKTKVIVAPGYNQADYITNVFNNPQTKEEFKNTGFVVLDAVSANKNTASVVFKAEQSAFLAALSLGGFLNKNEQQFGTVGDKFKVSTFGGMQFDSVTSFMAGFESGVNYFNHIADSGKVKKADGTTPLKKMEMVYAGSNFADNFSGSFVRGEAKTITTNLLGKGVQAILPVAGPQTKDVVDEIVANNKKTIVVGVDSPQELDNSVNRDGIMNFGTESSPNKKVIQFSALKQLEIVTNDVLSAIALDAALGTPGHNYNGSKGLGYTTVSSYKNKGIGVSAPGLEYLKPLAKVFNPSVNENDETAIYTSFPTWSDSAFSEYNASSLLLGNIALTKNISTSFQSTQGVFKALDFDSRISQDKNGNQTKPWAMANFLSPQDTPVATEKDKKDEKTTNSAKQESSLQTSA